MTFGSTRGNSRAYLPPRFFFILFFFFFLFFLFVNFCYFSFIFVFLFGLIFVHCTSSIDLLTQGLRRLGSRFVRRTHLFRSAHPPPAASTGGKRKLAVFHTHHPSFFLYAGPGAAFPSFLSSRLLFVRYTGCCGSCYVYISGISSNPRFSRPPVGPRLVSGNDTVTKPINFARIEGTPVKSLLHKCGAFRKAPSQEREREALTSSV
jgi:hypothetical protein